MDFQVRPGTARGDALGRIREGRIWKSTLRSRRIAGQARPWDGLPSPSRHRAWRCVGQDQGRADLEEVASIYLRMPWGKKILERHRD
jgi:hypothetical protein